MTIMANALKERIRRKELYIVVAVAAIILAVFGNDSTTLNIDGEDIAGFKSMFKVMHVIVNAAGCLLAMILSLRTIPAEYQEKRSHLVWIRGVSQVRYHTQLAIANFISSAIAVVILYVVLVVYAVTRGESLNHLGLAILVVFVNIAIISLLVSVLSIKLPSFAVGLIGSICVAVGVLHGILDIYKNIIGGLSGTFVKWVLVIMPDFNGIQSQAAGVVLGNGLDMHLVFKGLLTAFVISLGLWIFRKKEA